MYSYHNYIINYIDRAVEKNDYSYIVSKKKKKGIVLLPSPNVDKEERSLNDYISLTHRFDDIILEFSEIMNNDFREDLAYVFNRNIKHAEFHDYKFNIFKEVVDLFRTRTVKAYFTPASNGVHLVKNIDDDKVRHVIMHELLHMASFKNMVFTGLSQEIKTKNWHKCIGTAINEGYTEYLNQKYFAKDYSEAYKNEVIMAKAIENIVGEDYMMFAYFDLGLRPVVKKLGKIANDDTYAMDLILDMDTALKRYKLVGNSQQYKNIRKHIANIYMKKLNCEYLDEEVDEDEYERKKFIHNKLFVDKNIYLSDNTKIYDENKQYVIIDGDNKLNISKKEYNIKFKLDERIKKSNLNTNIKRRTKWKKN